VNILTVAAGTPVPGELAETKGWHSRNLAFLAGRIPKKLYATASSPIEGVIGT